MDLNQDLNQEVNKMTVTDRKSKELPIVNQELEKIVNEYYKLVRRSKFSEQELERMSEIWERAQEDERLSGWLEQIDFILADYDKSNPQCTVNEQEKDLAEKDEELQYFLSEHIEVLATQKIKARELKKNKFNSQNNSAFILLCPDGSGYQRIAFSDGGNGETIDQWSKQKCSQCGHSYSEHLKIGHDGQTQLGVSNVWYPNI